MKSDFTLFLLKCLLFLVPVPIVFEMLYKAGYTPAMTDSILFDRKMIATQRQGVKEVKIMGFGSSIPLYALNSELLVGQYHLPYYNFGSWRLQIADMKELLTVFAREYKPEYVILCSSIGDFRRGPDSTYLDYIRTGSFTRYHFPQLFYLEEYSSIFRLVYRVEKEKYIDFDPWGGMPLQIPAKDTIPGAWNAHWDFPTPYTTYEYRELDTLATFLRDRHIRLIFVQAPIKAAHANTPQAQRDLAAHFDTCRLIVEKRGGTYLNYYNTTIFADSLFFDQYHLQATGGKLMTKELLTDLKTIIK